MRSAPRCRPGRWRRKRRRWGGSTGRIYPRFQIITLAELFQGKKPDIPFVDQASVKRAKREETGRQERLI